MRHPLVRALAAGAAVFVATTTVIVAICAQVSGWQPPPQLEPLHPDPIVDRAAATAAITTRTTVSFRSAGEALRAVLIVPSRGADVGVVLVSGAGPADRLALLPLAEQIAASGIAVLTYDKRTDGYSALHRDYDQLADDALAAADTLRHATGAVRVGALGISEGGWVVSAAAARATVTLLNFVVLASAPVVSPLEQSSWATDSALREAPVLVRRTAATVVAQGRAIIDYLDFDPGPLLARIDVPVLAIWGADDATVPVNEAYRRLRVALGSALTAHIVGGAGHDIVGDPEPWLAIATDWMDTPSGGGLTGSEPARTSGVARTPASSLLTDPRLHAAVSAAIAIIVSLAVWHRARRTGQGANS